MRVLSKADIAGLIPHSGNMCLLEQVQIWTEDGITCTAIDHHDAAHPLRIANVLPAVCGIEYAAQAIAIHGALCSGESRSQNGLLASVREVTINVQSLNNVLGNLTIRAEKLPSYGNAWVYAFAVCSDCEELLRGQLSVFMHRGTHVGDSNPSRRCET
jgi:predicted hotdog family 3-hydroxylacyl-ACP dehydratase